MLKRLVVAVLLIVAFWYVASNYQDIEKQLTASSLTLPSIPVALAQHHSARLTTRLDQNALSQYNSLAEFHTWSPSACSAASIAAVLNFYGQNERVHDVLQ